MQVITLVDGQSFKLCAKLGHMVKFTKSEDKSYTNILEPLQFIEQGDYQIRVAKICIILYRTEKVWVPVTFILVGKTFLAFSVKNAHQSPFVSAASTQDIDQKGQFSNCV